MATSQVVNLQVGSEFGFKRPIFAPVPIMESIKSFTSTETIVGTLADISSKVLTFSTLSDFEFPIGNTSTLEVLATYGVNSNEVLKSWTLPFKQSITVTNVGNSDVTIFPRDPYRPTFSIPPAVFGNPGTYPVLHSSTGSYILSAGNTYDIELAYYGTDVGDFTSYLTIETTAGISTVTLFTNQIVLEETFTVEVTTTTFVVNTTELGKAEIETIYLTPVFNGIPNPDYILNLNASIVGDAGWTVTTGTNEVSIRWDPDIVSNSTGTYTSTLTIEADTETIDIENTSIVNIDYDLYRNLSTWISPAAGNNSIIGISFNIFDGVKTLTIGVGMGADGSPVYSEGGAKFVRIENLSIGRGTIDFPYPYWSTVYNIPLREAGTYLSGALDDSDLPLYLRKTSDGLTYQDYFGYEQSEGSMFVVEYDGYSTVNININNLRELSGDAEFDATMENLTRAFHYYSEQDSPERINNLPQYPLSTSTGVSTVVLPIGETRTKLFRGFVATSLAPTENWIVNTSVVSFPL